VTVAPGLLERSPIAMHQDMCAEVLIALRQHCPPDLVPVMDLSAKVDECIEVRPHVVVVPRVHYSVSPVPLQDVVLTVLVPVLDTAEMFATDHPWPIALDLPALTERRDALLKRG
jgi:hypothetical protein